MYWQLNRIIFPVYNLGPGKRIAIWVQGCSQACPGCISPDLWNWEKGREVDVLSLASGIIENAEQFDGITITGGEPFDQYEAFVSFASFIKLKSDLEILVFSGYTLEELIKKFPDKLFTKCLDYLIDGPFIQELQEDKNLRGSTNQKMYRFEVSAKADLSVLDGEISIHPVDFRDTAGKWSLMLDEKNDVFMTGIPKSGDFEFITSQLKNTGIKFELNK